MAAGFSFSYADLMDAVRKELGDSVPFDNIPKWITFAERWCERTLDIDCLRGRAEGPLSEGSEFIELPSDYVGFRRLYVSDGDTTWQVDLASPDRVIDYTEGERGSPEVCYARPDLGRLYVLPVPSESLTYTLLYRRSLERLSEANQTNALLEEHFDLLFYRTLLFAAPYLYEDQRLNVWNAFVQSIREDIEQEQWRKDNSDVQVARTHHTAF